MLFEYLRPDTYYARAFIDRNHNGVYDEGSLTDSIQPEETYYLPKRLKLKKNWDIEENWNIYETPLDQQKPLDIKKNKPAKKGGEMPEEDEYDEEDDEFGTNDFMFQGNSNDPFSDKFNNRGRTNNRNGRSNRSNRL